MNWQAGAESSASGVTVETPGGGVYAFSAANGYHAPPGVNATLVGGGAR
jgi:hypothetical protein